MKKILLCVLLWSLSFAAHAIYKCESNGATTYGEQPCASGKSTAIADASKPAASAVASAESQAAKDKITAKQLERERHASEAKQDKALNLADRRENAHRKKCARIAQQRKWALEDAAHGGSIRAREKAKKKERRLTAKYELECRQ